MADAIQQDPETIEHAAVLRALERDLEHARSRGEAMSSAIRINRLHPDFRSGSATIRAVTPRTMR